MHGFEGNFIGHRTKTVYNTETKEIAEYIVDFEYNIEKVSEHQYLVHQVNLSNGKQSDLLCFMRSNDDMLVSSSEGGIDNLCMDYGKIVHKWSAPKNCNDELLNAYIVLERVSC